jgi:hypothetical protein
MTRDDVLAFAILAGPVLLGLWWANERGLEARDRCERAGGVYRSDLCLKPEALIADSGSV